MTDEREVESKGTGSPPSGMSLLGGGRFRIGERLGIGSQGETFTALDHLQGRRVAIKRFDVHGANSWKDVELAEREARVLSTLRHPALPEYVHHFEEGGALYLVMEMVEGRNLAQCLEAGHRFSLDELARLLETLSDVFAYLHGQIPPVIHRDVKPSNIVRRSDGSFSLIDFGSVRDGLRPLGGSTVVGTFGFMAPEQFQGRAMPATDLYGAGATVLTLLTGITPDRLPHRGLEIDVREAVPPNTPPAWIDLLEKLLSADPDRRSVNLRSMLEPLRDSTRRQQRAGQVRDENNGRAPDDATKRTDATLPTQTEWLVGGGTTIPFFLLIALALLRLALLLVMQVAIPTLLNLLSLFIGRGLRQSAKDVARAGAQANRQLSEVIARVSKAGPMAIGRRHRMGGPTDWRPPFYPAPPMPRGPSQPPPRKRRMRVGNFDVELPQDPPAPDASEQKRRR